jgi:hypothetical protein
LGFESGYGGSSTTRFAVPGGDSKEELVSVLWIVNLGEFEAIKPEFHQRV